MKIPRFTPCSEAKFNDIPDLHFYESEGVFLYFDATHYFERSKMKERFSVEDFFTTFDYLIGSICETSGIGREELCTRDEKGHFYLEECLAIPYLMYVERWFGPYVFLRMEELLRLGVTLNDNMTRYLYESRFDHSPTEAPK